MRPDAAGSSTSNSTPSAVLEQELDAQQPGLRSDAEQGQNGSAAKHNLEQAGDSAHSSSPALRPHEAALAAALEANSLAAAFNSFERLLKAGDFPSDVACERLLKGKCDAA